jgi:hypothetical protein
LGLVLVPDSLLLLPCKVLWLKEASLLNKQKK